MPGPILFTATAINGSGTESRENESWRRLCAQLVLDGVTREDHFRDRVGQLTQLLDGLIQRFRKTALVSLSTVELAASVIEQVDEEFLGVEAWHRAEALPERIRKIASAERTEQAQGRLRGLRQNLRVMKRQIPELTRRPTFAVQFPDTMMKLSELQEDVLELLRGLRIDVIALVGELDTK